MDVERHKACELVDAIREALLAEGAPSRRHTQWVWHLEAGDLVPDYAVAPFYGIRVGAVSVTDEQFDRMGLKVKVDVGAYVDLAAAASGQRETGMAPRAPAARVGVLDLVWAAFQVLRGRGLANWGYVRTLGESETVALADAEGAPTGLVRRALLVEYALGVEFDPRT